MPPKTFKAKAKAHGKQASLSKIELFKKGIMLAPNPDKGAAGHHVKFNSPTNRSRKQRHFVT